jgi:hypothetical protein
MSFCLYYKFSGVNQNLLMIRGKFYFLIMFYVLIVEILLSEESGELELYANIKESSFMLILKMSQQFLDTLYIFQFNMPI